jgi:hypothetical protein
MTAHQEQLIESMGKRITAAMDIITEYGSIDGSHHKQWCLDQVVRALLPGKDYETWRERLRGEYDDEEEDYEYDEWDEGIAP